MPLRHRGDRPERRGTPADFLVIGLGNPGDQYAGTRHNIGFDVVDELCHRHDGKLRKGRERAFVDEVRVDGRRVALAEPQTYMNDSGIAAQLLVRRFGIDDLERVIVVHDELDLPLGRMKVKGGGGLAGHNGLRSLRDHLHSTDFLRVRIGVGKPASKEHGVDHVLRKVGKGERALLDEMAGLGSDAVETIIADGLEAAMTAFNGADRSGADG
ncbi:MAG: aminoacyl-tRNA hydrolase [Actinobacteria bacterium]|nr:aminoacyl-tRNA hydrolase [Actinomycetota bacterium]